MRERTPSPKHYGGFTMSLTNRFVKTLTICVTFFAMAPNLVRAESRTTLFKGYPIPVVDIKLVEPAKSKTQTPKFILDNATIKKMKEFINSPDGPRTGGGGNSCSLSIYQNTIKLDGLLKASNNLLSPDELSLLLSKIEVAKFYIGYNLSIDGQSKDAINYPDTNQIVVSDKFCNIDMNDVSGRSMSILLHEYLGLAKINDKKYQISGAFLQNYTTYLSKGYAFVANINLRTTDVLCESAAIMARQLGNSLVILTTSTKIEPFRQSTFISLDQDQMAAFAALGDRNGKEWRAPKKVRITDKSSGIEFLFTVVPYPSNQFVETLIVTMPNGKYRDYIQVQPGEPTTMCFPGL
jgi:hypothetical protein